MNEPVYSKAAEILRECVRRPFDHALAEEWVEMIVAAATSPVPWCDEHDAQIDDESYADECWKALWRDYKSGCRLQEPPRVVRINELG